CRKANDSCRGPREPMARSRIPRRHSERSRAIPWHRRKLAPRDSSTALLASTSA
ncbi:MAG: hypothetical protein AVDCRST_MAG42-2495, partial [uncultured Chthoniobacterales bacterium]